MPSSSTAVTQSYRTRSRAGSASWDPWVTKTHTSTEGFAPDLHHLPLNTGSDDGGPWFLTRSIYRPTLGVFDGVAGSLTFDGQITCQAPPGWVSPPGVAPATDGEIDAFGTTAIARTAPTNPAFDLSTSLGELASDGLPMVTGASLFKERASLARHAGSEYLNVEFGWLPLLRDVRKFAQTVKDSERILHEYRKGSGIKIRRGYDNRPSDTTTLYTGNMYSYPVYTNGPGTITYRGLSRAWFRGAFRYHIPVADDTVGKFQQWASMSDHLLGWKVTPETLWNIAPWSWATDWFANTGDIMSNVANLGRDGLVMQYGYSMSHRLRELRMTARFTARWGQVADVGSYQLTEYKQRRPATPYGFGINLQTLTPKQTAIIAALGLSRAK